jgi:hypothetical protein
MQSGMSNWEVTMTGVDIETEIMKQWVLLADGVKAGPIKPKSSFDGPADRNYQLKNKQIRKFLQWEDQIGMNIGWTSDASPQTATKVQRWFFTREGNGNSPIRYGETIAIANGKSPSFLHYDEQLVGVNLQWHGKPAYQWKLLGGKSGTEVKTGEAFAIYNEKDAECLIYVDRTVGGDIGWPSSQTWFSQIKSAFKNMAEDAIKDAMKDGVDSLLGK